MKNEFQVEVCIDSVDGAVAAEKGGADRVELCADFWEGGITPSVGLIEAVRSRTSLGLMVMIRPRGGDFCFSEPEVDVMQRDVAASVEAGADGIVIGALLADGQVDTATTQRLIECARPLSVTFHRAFDWTRDPQEALEMLLQVGVNRVLTSGQRSSAELGIPLLRQLVLRAAHRLAVMPGGGVSENNIARILRETGAREIHFSASQMRAVPPVFRRDEVVFATTRPTTTSAARVTSAERVRAILDAARATD